MPNPHCMMRPSKRPRRASPWPLRSSLLACGGFVLLFLATLGGVAQSQPTDSGKALIAFLNQSIAWYRHLQLPDQLATEPSDSIYANYNRTSSLQALSLIFQFAREQARQIQLQHPHTAPPATDTGQAASRSPQLVADAQQRIQQASAELDALQKQAAGAGGKRRQILDDQIAEEKSEFALAQARLETLENMSAFTTSETSAGLLGKINELERTVPEVEAMERRVHPVRPEPGRTAHAEAGGAASTAPAAAAAAPPFTPPPAVHAAPETAARQPGNGIISRASYVFSLIHKMNAESDAISDTAQLRSALSTVRQPLVDQLRQVIQRGEALSAQPESTDPAVLASRKQQIDALTADFKNLSAVVLPLVKANLLLSAASTNLDAWHGETESAYLVQGRALIVRIAFLAVAILLVAIAADFWRRAVFRYVREQRRRSQFLLIRRIVVTLVIVLILVFSLATELGSLATFAGFLTAGIAVALQNVILSVAAYFFLIGRYGIRIGDRIQIGDVTGDVVDIGLVRLHLVELDNSAGDARPTGRIVTFSNSVVFQPTSNFFKQLPGSNFAWRRISLTLAADVDYGLAQQRISAAVAKVYDTYKAELDQQHRTLERSLAVHLGSTEPRTRLRLEESGLEIVVLYPVVLSRAAQIDDLMVHALLGTIETEPRLRLVGGGLTSIQPVDATAGSTPPAAPEPHPAK